LFPRVRLKERFLIQTPQLSPYLKSGVIGPWQYLIFKSAFHFKHSNFQLSPYLNSGDSWYLANSSCQCSSVSGGRSPVRARQMSAPGLAQTVYTHTHTHTHTNTHIHTHAHTHASYPQNTPTPVNFQSVMDSPDLVSRVAPPSTTMVYTHTAVPPTHHTSCLRKWFGTPEECCGMHTGDVGHVWVACRWAGLVAC
jgi:hypothetical protein